MSLTDEQLLKLWAPEPSRPVMGRNKILEFARAIESAATAPLLERIAELERELEAVRNEVLEEAANTADELQAPQSCSTVEKSLWDVATTAAGDAIRALKDKK